MMIREAFVTQYLNVTDIIAV